MAGTTNLTLGILICVVSATASGCFIVPGAGPVIEQAEAGCLTDGDTGDEFWLLDARVSHPDQVPIERVFVDVEDFNFDYMGSVQLTAEEPGYWARSVASDSGFLDCTPGLSYHFTFIAEDEQGRDTDFSFSN